MDTIINNWYLIFLAIVITLQLVLMAKSFFSKPSKEQIETVKQWLVFACAKAEKELGSGTGELKLRFVYDLFMNRFPSVAKAISFEQFTTLTEEALVRFRVMLETNENVEEIINAK